MSDAGQHTEQEQAVTARIGAVGYSTEIRTPDHALRADEPRSMGGTDAGPGPYDLLLASLAACKAMTLRMYADRKNWPLKGAKVRLRHHRVHARDCDDCETKEGHVDVIDGELELTGELDEQQRQRLAEIADKCPVHRTLTTETQIRTRLADGEAAS